MGASTQKKRAIDHWIEMEQLLRNQRHDFMNAFQIVSGYIQLGQTEKALEQIRQIANYSNQMGRIFHLQCVPLAMMIMETINSSGIGDNRVSFEVQSIVNMETYLDINVEDAVEQVKKFLVRSLTGLNESNSQETIHIKIEEHEMCWILFIQSNQYIQKEILEPILTDLQLHHTCGDDMIIIYFKLKKQL